MTDQTMPGAKTHRRGPAPLPDCLLVEPAAVGQQLAESASEWPWVAIAIAVVYLAAILATVTRTI
jgi:hypothetical protein